MLVFELVSSHALLLFKTKTRRSGSCLHTLPVSIFRAGVRAILSGTTFLRVILMRRWPYVASAAKFKRRAVFCKLEARVNPPPPPPPPCRFRSGWSRVVAPSPPCPPSPCRPWPRPCRATWGPWSPCCPPTSWGTPAGWCRSSAGQEAWARSCRRAWRGEPGTPGTGSACVCACACAREVWQVAQIVGGVFLKALMEREWSAGHH